MSLLMSDVSAVKIPHDSIHVSCSVHTVPTPNASVSVPSGPLYEGTSHTLTCSVTLHSTVDTDVTVTVDWTLDSTPITSSDHVVVSPVSGVRSSFMSTLRLSPLIMTDAGQYSCQATATSSSPYITGSGQGLSSEETLTVTGMCNTIGHVHISGICEVFLSYFQLFLVPPSTFHSLATQLLARSIL